MSLYARLTHLIESTRNRPEHPAYLPDGAIGAYLPNGTAQWESSFAAWKKARAAGGPLTADLTAWAEPQGPLLERRIDGLKLPIPERYADYVKAEPNRYGDIEYIRRMKSSAMRAKLRERAIEEGLADRLMAQRLGRSIGYD